MGTNCGGDQGNQGLKWKNTGALGREGLDEEKGQGWFSGGSDLEIGPWLGEVELGGQRRRDRRQALPVSSLQPGPSFQEDPQ